MTFIIIIVLCTISWRAGSQKRQLWRAELILLQNRYKKQREKQKKKEREKKERQREKKRKNICGKVKRKKDTSV